MKELTEHQSMPIAIDPKWESALKGINSFMPEIQRGVSQIAKRNSQTSMSLMTLNMIDSGPYRVLAQILVQIDTKYGALKDIVFKLKKNMANINILESQETLSEIERIKLEKLKLDTKDARAPLENIIREIGALQQRYKEVIANKGIPENWTEQDFENAEIEHHIKSIFRNAIRDRMAGNCNMGTMEYMEQFGIEPMAAYALVDNFLIRQRRIVQDHLAKNEVPPIKLRYEFYDDMYNIFKDEYKKAMQRIGLNSIQYADWLMKDNT